MEAPSPHAVNLIFSCQHKIAEYSEHESVEYLLLRDSLNTQHPSCSLCLLLPFSFDVWRLLQ